jgi:hypothetical protein
MHNQLNHIIAQQRSAELSRLAADRHRADQSRPQPRPTHPRRIRRVAALVGRISAARA